MRLKWYLLLGIVWLAARPALVAAQYLLEDVKDKDRYSSGYVVLPFALYTSSYRLGGGVVWNGSGLVQPQTNTSAVVLGSVNGSYGVLTGINDLQIKPVDRLFADFEFAFFQENQFTAYLDRKGSSRNVAAGSNDSSKRDFFVTQNDDSWGSVNLRYLLPIGGARDVVINRYILDNGLLQDGATGGAGWNPLHTGRTYLQVTPFYEYVTLETPVKDLHVDTNGFRFGVLYDNTDFPLNPSAGNTSRITASRDFGLFNSTNPWTTVEGELTQYFDVGESRWFRQQVVALQGWTAYSPSWSDTGSGARRSTSNAPPFYEGATLGGRDRLRGFDEGRFHDRAALYGSVEFRVIPRFNPFEKIALFKKADIAWMQWVLFAEAGRVADEYTPELLSHLKGDVGFGMRLLANDTLVRFDVAASSEGYSLWVGLGQPF